MVPRIDPKRALDTLGEFLGLLREWEPMAGGDVHADPLLVEVKRIGFDPIGDLQSKINRRMSTALGLIDAAGARLTIRVPGHPEPIDPFTALFFPRVGRVVITHAIHNVEVAMGRYADAAGETASVACSDLEAERVFTSGQTFDAFVRIIAILKTAQTQIAIVDGFVGNGTEVLGMCTERAPGVAVRILTKDPSSAFRIAAQRFNAQHGGLEARDSTAFHDRFVIVDDRDVFHFGASLKDAGKSGFVSSRLEERVVVDAIRSEWSRAWTAASVIV
jgi:hypothetical protein